MAQKNIYLQEIRKKMTNFNLKCFWPWRFAYMGEENRWKIGYASISIKFQEDFYLELKHHHARLRLFKAPQLFSTTISEAKILYGTQST